MLSICTQTAISVLHDIALGNALQSVNYLLSAEEWKDLFDKLEKGHLIRCLPDKEPGESLFVCLMASSVGNLPVGCAPGIE